MTKAIIIDLIIFALIAYGALIFLHYKRCEDKEQRGR